MQISLLEKDFQPIRGILNSVSRVGEENLWFVTVRQVRQDDVNLPSSRIFHVIPDYDSSGKSQDEFLQRLVNEKGRKIVVSASKEPEKAFVLLDQDV